MQGSSFNILAESEWILTNGLGGYALGFGNMINKRKYNGLLIASGTDFKRNHLLSSMEEKVEDDGVFFYIDSNHYPNCIYPNGYRHVVKTWFRPNPAVLYSSAPFNRNYLIFKEMFLPKGFNAVVIKYTNMGSRPVTMMLRPKLSLRDHHMLNSPGTFDRVGLDREIESNRFKVRRHDNGLELHGYVTDGEMMDDTIIYRNVFYPVEAIRGYEAVEDLISPVRITLSLNQSRSAYLIFSATPIEDHNSIILEAQRVYKLFPLPADYPTLLDPVHLLARVSDRRLEFDRSSYLKILEFAVRDFITDDGNIVAGYPWFGPWARDTLISMGGLKYLPDGDAIAVDILKKYGKHINSGLLPNTFGEGGVGMNYDSVDAPLWYVLRAHEYDPADKDLLENVSSIILNYLFEEIHPFSVAEDGLIEIRKGDYALTWMDAKLYNHPVTPRFGKPIEINALWYNALCAARDMLKMSKIRELKYNDYSLSAKDLEELIKRVHNSLQQYVGQGFVADRIEDGVPVWEVRPNAVIALSLPFDFVDHRTIKQVWQVAKDKLLTPYGLRTLDPSHPAFKKKYVGNQKLRDLSYHQGTVWAFLLLPFVKLTMKAFDNDKGQEELSREVAGYVWAFRDGFMRGEMSSIAEIWDGIDPFLPKGCPAQAWSVFALFEIEQLLMRAWR